MKSAGKFSIVALATLFCFASSVFGQTSATIKATSSFHFSTPVLALAVGHGDHDRGGNGCSNHDRGDREWDWNGWGGGNGGGGNGGDGGGCSSVPEGGSSLVYLSLVSLCCLGVGLWKSRRQPATSVIVS
jgi:hypothetical protein